jgi:hypothetical protein
MSRRMVVGEAYEKKGVFPSVLISLLVVVVLSVEMGEMG